LTTYITLSVEFIKCIVAEKRSKT